jgi:hypothetical protein
MQKAPRGRGRLRQTGLVGLDACGVVVNLPLAGVGAEAAADLTLEVVGQLAAVLLKEEADFLVDALGTG